MIAVAFAAGFGVVSLLRLRPKTGAGLLGGIFFFGVLWLALWTHLLLLAKIPLGLPSLVAGAGAMMIAGFARWEREMFRVSWRPSWSSVPVLLAVLFGIAGAVSWPLLGYDGEVYYALKAKSLVYYGTFWNPDYTDPARLHPSARRPLLIPCLYADFYLLAGTTDGRVLRLWFALLHAASIGVVHDRFRPRPLWLTVFAWLPILWHDSGGVFTGYGDVLLGILLLLAMDGLRNRQPALAAGALALAALLKQDAWPFLVALFVATLVFRREETLRTTLVLAVPAALILAWSLLSSGLRPADEGSHTYVTPARLIGGLGNWPHVVARYGSELVKPSHWGFFWLVIAGGIVLLARDLTREDGWWLLAGGLQLFAYMAVTTAQDPAYIHFATKSQAMRLAFHVAPIFWYCVGRRWAEKEDYFSKQPMSAAAP